MGLYEICYLNPAAFPERLVPTKLNLGNRNKLTTYDLSVFAKRAVLMALYVHGGRLVALPAAFQLEQVEPPHHARGEEHRGRGLPPRARSSRRRALERSIT